MLHRNTVKGNYFAFKKSGTSGDTVTVRFGPLRMTVNEDFFLNLAILFTFWNNIKLLSSSVEIDRLYTQLRHVLRDGRTNMEIDKLRQEGTRRRAHSVWWRRKMEKLGSWILLHFTINFNDDLT